MKVGDWMNRRVVSCRASDTANVVARLMWDEDVGSVPVVDGDRRIVGIVTDRDLCMSAYIQGRPLSEVTISGCMQRQVHTCRPEEGIDRAIAVMTERQVRRLPVVGPDESLVGSFSLGDAARAAAGMKESRARRLLSEAVGLAFAAITSPRSPEPEDEKVIELAPAPPKKAGSAPSKAAKRSAKR